MVLFYVQVFLFSCMPANLCFLVISLKKLIYFNWRLITILWWFLPYTDMNQPQVYMCLPQPEPASHLPAHLIPLGSPSAPTLSALFHDPNLDYSSILHRVIYMFQCYSLKLSHPRLLPQSPKVFSLYLCLFCCIAYSVVVTTFLNSIYMY